MKREEDNEERERIMRTIWQPGGEERIKNATLGGMLRWCQYLSQRKRSCQYLSVGKGRDSI